MFRFARTSAFALPLALAAAAPAQPGSGTTDPAVRFARFMDELQADPNAPPGAAVIVLRGNRTLYARAFGVRDARSRQPLTLDVPMYNGSTTKAYTGVLAALLDADGTLPLDSSLADTWPNLTLKPPLDARKITARQLLSHVSGMKADSLTFRATWIGNDPIGSVKAQLAEQAVPTSKPGFVYQNFGPNLWSRLAEQRTGQPWNVLLRQRVLRPLGLNRSTGRLEDFGAAGVSHCHVREAKSWLPQPAKPTATMTAAGGMYASTNDAARFLRAIMTDGVSAGGAIPATVLRRTWQPASVQDKDIMGMHRDGYGLGWDLGTISGHRFVARSGDYPGCGAMMLFVPDLDLGIVIQFNGDLAPSSYRKAVIAQAIDNWSSNDGASAARAAARVAETRAAWAKDAAETDGRDPVSRAQSLDPALSRMVVGSYRDPRLGAFQVRRAGGGLRLTAGVFDQPLRWAGKDQFLVRAGFDIEPVELIRDAAGRVIALQWIGHRLDRVGG